MANACKAQASLFRARAHSIDRALSHFRRASALSISTGTSGSGALVARGSNSPRRGDASTGRLQSSMQLRAKFIRKILAGRLPTLRTGAPRRAGAAWGCLPGATGGSVDVPVRLAGLLKISTTHGCVAGVAGPRRESSGALLWSARELNQAWSAHFQAPRQGWSSGCQRWR